MKKILLTLVITILLVATLTTAVSCGSKTKAWEKTLTEKGYSVKSVPSETVDDFVKYASTKVSNFSSKWVESVKKFAFKVELESASIAKLDGDVLLSAEETGAFVYVWVIEFKTSEQATNSKTAAARFFTGNTDDKEGQPSIDLSGVVGSYGKYVVVGDGRLVAEVLDVLKK